MTAHEEEETVLRGEGAALFLVGFMGAGKSTIGHALARRLGYRFVDLDSLIESRAGMTVRDLFEEKGETGFRQLERAALKSLEGATHIVAALGGGAFTSEENRALLKQIGLTVWLDCPLDVCLSRIQNDGRRPLLDSPERMRALLEQRRPSYALADLTVTTGAQSVDEVAELIIAGIAASHPRRRKR